MIQWINVPSDGVYDRPLQAQRAAHGVPFARITSKQARRFAEGIGQRAKTDKVDAAVLARMGSLLDPEAEKPRAQSANDLKDLTTARQAFLLAYVYMQRRGIGGTIPAQKLKMAA